MSRLLGSGSPVLPSSGLLRAPVLTLLRLVSGERRRHRRRGWREGWRETASARLLSFVRPGNLSEGGAGQAWCSLLPPGGKQEQCRLRPPEHPSQAGQRPPPALAMEGQAARLSFPSLCELSPSGSQMLPTAFSPLPRGLPKRVGLLWGSPAGWRHGPRRGRLSAPRRLPRVRLRGAWRFQLVAGVCAVAQVGGAPALCALSAESRSLSASADTHCPLPSSSAPRSPPGLSCPGSPGFKPTARGGGARLGSARGLRRRAACLRAFLPPAPALRVEPPWPAGPKGSGWGGLGLKETGCQGKGLPANSQLLGTHSHWVHNMGKEQQFDSLKCPGTNTAVCECARARA